jgi:hypothetical protein
MYNVAGGGWLQTIQVPIWAEEMRWLLPSFLRPFEAGPHPSFNITTAKLLRPSASTAGLPGTSMMPLRAKVFEEGPCPMPCLHIVVVNVLEDTPVAFTIEVEAPGVAALVGPHGKLKGHQVVNASRLFDGGYNTSLGFRGDTVVTLEDFIGPGDTNIYEVGCEGPRPNLKEGNDDGSNPPWEACANRRVMCWDHTHECSGV